MEQSAANFNRQIKEYFEAAITVLNCLLGKDFTNIIHISGNGGTGEYCVFSYVSQGEPIV